MVTVTGLPERSLPEIRDIIRQVLGRLPKELFADFEAEQLAAAAWAANRRPNRISALRSTRLSGPSPNK